MYFENVEGNPLYLWSASSRPIIKIVYFTITLDNDIREHNVGSSYHPQMNNCYYSRTGDFNTASETGNLTSGTIDFYDSNNDDFRIGYSSVCKDAGTPTGAPAVDFAETARNGDSQGYDIGCYEYVCSTASSVQQQLPMRLDVKELLQA